MTNLKKGSTGSAVVTMQTMLIACGYSCGASGADGDFGKNTLAAVTAFQEANGLEVDGIYGSLTRAALEKAYDGASDTTPASVASSGCDAAKVIGQLVSLLQ